MVVFIKGVVPEHNVRANRRAPSTQVEKKRDWLRLILPEISRREEENSLGHRKDMSTSSLLSVHKIIHMNDGIGGTWQGIVKQPGEPNC